MAAIGWQICLSLKYADGNDQGKEPPQRLAPQQPRKPAQRQAGHGEKVEGAGKAGQ
jgi:hypothetical protein